MNTILNTVLFNDKNHSPVKKFYFAVLFFFFTVIALGLDSSYFSNNYFDGKPITNFLAVVYFSLFFFYSDSKLRRLMTVMVFLSYIGELIFCNLLGMYDYRLGFIPLYVPLGHAIVYASGYVFAHTEWAIKNDKVLKKYFAISFSCLFLFVGIVLNDIFSLVFGASFFFLMRRKKWQNLYYFIALCVIFIELVGTYFQCWKWSPKIFGFIPTINPPMGAVFFYAGGDSLLVKIINYWKFDKTETTICS